MRYLIFAMMMLAGVAHADTWITTTHHEGDLPLYRATLRGFYDGNQLWSTCNSAVDSASYTICIAYIAGVTDVFVNEYTNNICLPTNATEGQLTDVVTKYLRDYPERRHFLAHTIVAASLSAAFPCGASP